MITLEKAKKALEASEKKAKELGAVVSTAIADDHGELIAFSKMDGAINISPRFSLSKAFTSANVGIATGDIAGYAAEGKPYFGVESAMGGKLNIIPGGVPVMDGAKIVGGVGVGGSQDVKQDEQCAKAAVEALG